MTMKPVPLALYEALLPSKRKPVRFGHKDNTYPAYRMKDQKLELGNNFMRFSAKLTVPLASISNVDFAPGGYDGAQVLSVARIATTDGATYLLTVPADAVSASSTWNHWVQNH